MGLSFGSGVLEVAACLRVPRGSVGNCWQSQEVSARMGNFGGLGFGRLGMGRLGLEKVLFCLVF